MMKVGDFEKIPLKDFAPLQERETSEAKFWKTFNVVKEIKLLSSPNYIDFDPTNSGAYIVTASVKVSLFDGLTDRIQRSYTRFSADAYSGKYRKDGKLILAGDKTGAVKVFDVQTKALLRQMRRHNSAVRAIRWSSDGQNFVSASDDRKVFRWDLATEEILWTSKSFHNDYVRALETHPLTPELFMSAGYDHQIALWDSRQSEPCWSINHGNPIEHCLFTPSGSLAITAGGSEVKIWDIMSGGKLIHTFNNHQKNVTSLALDGSTSRLLSAGLDGHVKVYSLEDLQVVHGMKFNSPILSLGLSPDNRKLIVGFVNGDLMIRNNKKETSSDILSTPAENPYPSMLDAFEQQLSQNRFHKGAGKVYEFKNTVTIESERQLHLQPYEKHLKKFNYQKALDTSLETRNPIIVVTVLEELCRRDGLTIALSGRDETSLEPLLAFIVRYINNSRYSNLIIQVAHRLLDIYSCILGFSETIDDLFIKLQKQIETELIFQKEITRTMGAVDCIINVSTMPKRRKIEDTREDILPA